MVFEVNIPYRHVKMSLFKEEPMHDEYKSVLESYSC